MNKKLNFYSLLFISLFFFSCKSEILPKPWGYLRLEYKEQEIKKFQSDCGFSFKTSQNAMLEERGDRDCWFDLYFPDQKAHLYITKKDFSSTEELNNIAQDVEKFTFDHSIKADYIKSRRFENRQKEVYAQLFDVGGEVASNLQFGITDSTSHYFTGSLYFNTRPNPDSLAPAINFIKNRVNELVETFQWE